jgi:hypothetical protein
VLPDVVFDYFRHQASDRTPRTSDQLQDLSAAQSLVKCPLDSLDLPANATHPVQQLGFLSDGVGHRAGSFDRRCAIMSIPPAPCSNTVAAPLMRTAEINPSPAAARKTA